MKRSLSILVLAVLGAACGDAGTDVRTPLNLDRPVDIAFSCYGGLRITGGDGAQVEDPVTVEPQPMESCRIRSRWAPPDERADPPPGQEDLTGDGGAPVTLVEYYAFILQSVPGTVAIAHFETIYPGYFSGIEVLLDDADPLTPGSNSITVGSLPVAIATDRTGCHAFTANAGSCDLSVIGIESVVDRDPSTPADIRAVTVTNALGEEVLARPATMIAEPGEADQPIGVECPAEPEGLVYIAYPDCHIVAAVRPGTGRIEAAIRFNPDGTVELTDGNVSCPAQCGVGGTVVAGERPVTLDLLHDARVDTRRLVVGAEDSPMLTVVELDDGYLPLSFSRVALEGDVGVIDVAFTPQIGMGGEGGLLDDSGAAGGQHQFVYAVTTDGTIRVADVLGANVECDTQIDPRYLRGVADVGRLACLPVGDAATPPRRATARGPGIELEGGVPLSVTVVPSEQVDIETGMVVAPEEPRPGELVGYFAFVTSSRGDTFIINVDDDTVRDLWDAADPLGTMIPHVIAHQVRDEDSDRNETAFTQDGDLDCSDSGGALGTGGPRLDDESEGDGITLQDFDQVSSVKSFVMPGVRGIPCDDDEEALGKDTPEHVTELSFAAPVDVRDLTYPDLRAMKNDERWFFTWEGPLSRDDSGDAIDGPSIRLGVVERDGNHLTIGDATRPFSAKGGHRVQNVLLAGCDPDAGDAQCGVGRTCYTHPDSTVSTGVCLPLDEAEALAATCRDFLVSLRRYSISSAHGDELRIMPRRRVLSTTPVDGCVSADQCQDLALHEARLASPEHPIDWEPDPADPVRSYTCGLDPTRGGPDRCMMTCETTADCDDGTRCSNGWCVEGVVPPAECLEGVQRFQVRGGDALVVVGEHTGHLHPIIENPATGACEPDPAAHPLLVGRIPLDPPPCPGPDDYDQLAPNPCSTTVTHTAREPGFELEGGVCVGGGDDPSDNALELVTRDAPAIRFKNPALGFHLVDPWYPGDLECRGDRAAGLTMPTLRNGYQLQLRILAGLDPHELDVPTVFPINIVRGPENSIWVIDEGDNVPDFVDSSSTRGQVFRFEPSTLGAVNIVQ